MKPEQPDLFCDILPASRRGRKRKTPAEVVVFPLERNHRSVRQMAEIMSRMSSDARNSFWRNYSRKLIEELVAERGLRRGEARAAVLAFTAAVRRLTAFLAADPAARLGGRGGE